MDDSSSKVTKVNEAGLCTCALHVACAFLMCRVMAGHEIESEVAF